MKLASADRRDERPPFVHGIPADSQHSSDLGVIAAEVPEDVRSTHRGRAYTTVDCQVNVSGRLMYASGVRDFTLRSTPMDKKHRRVPRGPFNGDAIRELREARELSQEQLAEVIGTGKQNVSKWERSRAFVAISFDLFMNLAKALHVAPEVLAKRLASPPAAASASASRAPRPPGRT